jgi:signal transduction histidine kinase
MNSRDPHQHRPGPGPPAWWPRNEPWPPPAGRGRWKRRRRGFLLRIAAAFVVLLVLSAVGLNTLVVAFLNRAGVTGVQRLVPVLLIAGVSLALLVLSSFVAMRRVGIPLSDIVEAAARVAEGDFSVRVVERGPRSLRSVGRAFNSMTTRLEANERHRQQLMADVAHELRTPLAIIQARLEGLIDGIYERDDDQLKALLGETRTLARLVEDVRTLANAESGTLGLQKESTDLTVLIHDVAASFSDAATEDMRIAVRVETSELPLIDVDPVRIREVIANLLSNAVRHSAAGGVVSIAATVSAGSVMVTVADSGPGLAAEELSRVFDRFYKDSRSTGSGLGLTIARNLVQAHGGDIRAESRVGDGTRMTVTLPLPGRHASPSIS